MTLTEKDIIEKGKFLIADQEAGARIPSFLARWHDENAMALTAMLDSYIRLNMLEQLSLRLSGKSLTDLLSTFGDVEIDRKKLFRAKYIVRAKEKRGRETDGANRTLEVGP